MAEVLLKKVENPDGTINLYGVDILDTGIVRGQFRFDLNKIDEIVKNFKILKDKIRIPVKLGHGDDQITKRSGYPAVGWIENIYREGTKLFADITNIPAKVAQLIELRAYIQKSVELAWNYVDTAGKEYGTALLGLAFLGEELPEIKTLDDILGLYQLDRSSINASFAAVSDLLKFSESLDLMTISSKVEGGSIMPKCNTDKKTAMAENEQPAVVAPVEPAAAIPAGTVPAEGAEVESDEMGKASGFADALKQFNEAIESVKALIAQKSLTPEEMQKLEELRASVEQLGNLIPTLFSQQKNADVKVDSDNKAIDSMKIELSGLRDENKILRQTLEKFDVKFSEIEAEKKKTAVIQRVDKLVAAGKLAPAFKDEMVGLIVKVKETAPDVLTFSDGKQSDAADAMLSIFEKNETVDLSEEPKVKPVTGQAVQFEKSVNLSASDFVDKLVSRHPDLFGKKA